MAKAEGRESHVRRVHDILKGYAGRGFFRSISDGIGRGGKTTFTMLWHHGRTFRFVLDTAAGSVSFPELLPAIPARSLMAKELKVFLHQFETDDVPLHRRVEPDKASLQVSVRNGSASVGLKVHDGEFEYATRRLVHLAQEVFMVFLIDGPYFDYRVEHLGVNPDV
jgi:hypothetical protein